MSKLWDTLASYDQPVMSPLLGHVDLTNAAERKRGLFEVLVRHLFDRLLCSESLGAGDETATRITQMAYAVALPGLVIALFLDPLYHSPLGPRHYWAQASDHFFYVTYSFLIMGLGTVLQWDLLFPDQLDVFVLTSLPIRHAKLLFARVLALTIFLGSILLGANILGWGGFTVAADLRDALFLLPASHAVAVLAAGLCVSAFLIALQGTFICVLGQRIARRLAPIAQALCVLLLLTTFFLFPLLSHFLENLVRSHNSAIFWFPPFWFLGLYEHMLMGSSAGPVFAELAHIGLRTTAAVIVLALITYPLAYARRMRQIVEGAGTRSQRGPWKPLDTLLHRTLLREFGLRAIYHYISQTLWRTQHLRLLLATFGGLGLAMTISSVLLIRVGHESLSFQLSAYGVRLAVPVLAFWLVAGLRAAFRAPVTPAASWAFRIIHGRPKHEHLYGAEVWVAASVSLITLVGVVVLHKLETPELHAGRDVLMQGVTAIAVSILLTDVFFFHEKAIPFTEAPSYSVSNLSVVVITYFALFPAFTLGLVGIESWMEATPLHFLIAILCAAATHIILRHFKAQNISERAKAVDMDEVILIPGEMGLRN